MKGETDDAAAVSRMAGRFARLCGIWDAARMDTPADATVRSA